MTALEPGMPAMQAGIKVGDVISAVNGTAIHSTKAMIDILQKTKDQPVELTVLHDGQERKPSRHAGAEER